MFVKLTFYSICHIDEDRWLSGSHSLFPSQPLQQAQLVFPSALCSASVLLINLLDDTAINEHGTAGNSYNFHDTCLEIIRIMLT